MFLFQSVSVTALVLSYGDLFCVTKDPKLKKSEISEVFMI